MALAGRVLDENDLTRADLARLAVAGGYLHAGVEVDDVLAARRVVPVEIVGRRHLAEDEARRRPAVGNPSRPAALRGLALDAPAKRTAPGVHREDLKPH